MRRIKKTFKGGLSLKKKKQKSEYTRNWYWNIFKENKQKLKEFGKSTYKHKSEKGKRKKKEYMKGYLKEYIEKLIQPCNKIDELKM